jgi:hypothetical protein
MTIQFIPDPRGIVWEDWVSAFVGYNPELRSSVDPLAVPWEDFARRLTLVDANTPRPDFFEDWRSWAEALRRSLAN